MFGGEEKVHTDFFTNVEHLCEPQRALSSRGWRTISQINGIGKVCLFEFVNISMLKNVNMCLHENSP